MSIITYGAKCSPNLTPGSWTPMTDTGTAPVHTFSVPITAQSPIFLRLRVSSGR